MLAARSRRAWRLGLNRQAGNALPVDRPCVSGSGFRSRCLQAWLSNPTLRVPNPIVTVIANHTSSCWVPTNGGPTREILGRHSRTEIPGSSPRWSPPGARRHRRAGRTRVPPRPGWLYDGPWLLVGLVAWVLRDHRNRAGSARVGSVARPSVDKSGLSVNCVRPPMRQVLVTGADWCGPGGGSVDRRHQHPITGRHDQRAAGYLSLAAGIFRPLEESAPRFALPACSSRPGDARLQFQCPRMGVKLCQTALG